MSAISAKVATLLGQTDDAVVEEATEIVTALAQRYTRGNVWTADAPEVPIEKVIVIAAARLAFITAQVKKAPTFPLG